MTKVLITGASGLIGRNLVEKYVSDSDNHVIAISDNMDFLHEHFGAYKGIEIASRNRISDYADQVDMIINCSFPRSSDKEELASALKYTERLATIIRECDKTSLLNISSQGVYKRTSAGKLVSEDDEISPMDIYSMSKYSTELIFNATGSGRVTNIRLASINMKQRFLYAFVDKVIRGESLSITAPNRYASIMDVRDAVSGIMAIAETAEEKRAALYNLGTGNSFTILDYAELVVEIGREYGFCSQISISETEVDSNGAGMDCSRVMKDCDWKPEITREMMIREMFDERVSDEQ